MKNYVIAHDLGTTGNTRPRSMTAKENWSAAPSLAMRLNLPRPVGPNKIRRIGGRRYAPQPRPSFDKQTLELMPSPVLVFSGQMMGCVPLDQAGRPLRKAIIWADQRAVDQEQWVGERVGADEVYQITGHRLSASYSLHKILWLRDHQPDVYAATHKFVHAKDAIVARLTGNFVTDPSDASGMNLYDLEGGQWSERIIEATELNPTQLPDIHRSTDIVGEVVAYRGGLRLGSLPERPWLSAVEMEPAPPPGPVWSLRAQPTIMSAPLLGLPWPAKNRFMTPIRALLPSPTSCPICLCQPAPCRPPVPAINGLVTSWARLRSKPVKPCRSAPMSC